MQQTNVAVTGIYAETAKYHDLLYPWIDYDEDSEKIANLIKEKSRNDGKKMLILACGTGGNIPTLKDKFDITGLDINERMLTVARKKFPNIPFVQGDMTNFELNEQFDAIICLAGSIGYAGSTEESSKVMQHAYRHLRKGGLLIIENYIDEDKYKLGEPSAVHNATPDTKISRFLVFDREEDTAILDIYYLIAERNEGVICLREKHELGLFNPSVLQNIMAEAGFEASYMPGYLRTERSILIGVK